MTSALTTRDSIVETEAAHDPGEMVGAARPPIDEHDAQVRPGAGDHQAWNAATAAEVDHGAGLAGEGGDECHGVLDDLRDRPTPEHAQALRCTERRDQLGVVLHPSVRMERLSLG